MARIHLHAGVADLNRGVLVRVDGTTERLTTRESELLAYLADRPSVALSRQTLLADVWGYHPDVNSRALDTAIKGLRRKVEQDRSSPDHIHTVWGVGYRFEPAVAKATDGFVGRGAELEELRARLVPPGSVAVVLGPGGVGKSRLVLEAFPAAVVLRLDEVAAIDRVDVALAHALPPSDLPLETRLAQLDVPLVLDDAERFAGSLPDRIATWRRHAPGLRMVVTSRVALDLPSASRIRLATLGPADAEALLRSRLAEADGDDAVVAALVDRLDGLPLAIELVGAWSALLSPSELLARLEQLVHTTGPQGDHRSMDDVVRRSIELLEPVGRAVLSRCAMFAGSFEVSDIEALCPDEALVGLAALRRASLLARADDGRLRLLPLVREVVRHLLPPDADARVAFAEHVVTGAEGVAHLWIDLEAVFADDTLPAAMVARAGLALVATSHQRGEGFVDDDDTRRIMDHAGRAGVPALVARAAVAEAQIALRTGRATAAQLERARREAEVHGDRQLKIRAWALTGVYHRMRSEVPESLEAFGRAQELGEGSGLSHELVLLGTERALTLRMRGKLGAAIHALETALEHAERLGPVEATLVCRYRLGTTLVAAGHLDAARIWLDRASDLALELQHPARWHQVQSMTSMVALEAGDLDTFSAFVAGEVPPGGEAWFHAAVRLAQTSLYHTERGALAEAAEAATRSVALVGESRSVALALARLSDGVWRAFASDPGSRRALEEVSDLDDYPWSVYAGGWLAALDGLADSELDPGESLLVHQFVAVLRGEMDGAPPTGVHARLLRRFLSAG